MSTLKRGHKVPSYVFSGEVFCSNDTYYISGNCYTFNVAMLLHCESDSVALPYKHGQSNSYFKMDHQCS